MPVGPFTIALRRLRSRLRYLSGYLHVSRSANQIVRRTDFTHCERPVLMIYGFMATRRSFEVMERRLRRDGYCVFSINLGGLADMFNTRSIDEAAAHIAAKIERLYARYTLGPLTIIGHSKGGLIGLYYLKYLGGDRRAQTLITLGTPHNGTRSAYLGLPFAPFARSILQMTPSSRFRKELQAKPLPDSVYLASLYSRADRVCPYPAAVLAPQSENRTNLEVDAPHHDLLLRKKVYDVLRGQLEAAEAYAQARRGGPKVA